MRWVVRILVTTLMLSSAVASAAGERKLDKTAKLDGSLAAISGEIGGFKILKVELKNMPDDEELADARAKEPSRVCHPRVSVDFENKGNVKLNAKFEWALLDKKGVKLTGCSKDATVDPRSKPDYKICFVDDIRCVDTPQISSARLIATTEDAEVTLDKTYPFKSAIADINEKLGDLTVDKVYVDQAPTAKDIEKAKSDPTDTSSPWVNLLFSNPSDSSIKVGMHVVLVDDAGTVYATCDETAKVKAHVRSQDYTVCKPTVPTADWPKITKAQVTVALKSGWF